MDLGGGAYNKFAPSTISERRGTLLIIIATAIGIRCLAVLFAIVLFDVAPRDIPEMRDGRSYLAYAAAASEGRDGFEQLSSYDRRVFPGYPLILALVQAHRWPAAAIGLSILCAAGAAALAFLVFEDARVGVAMAILTPSYVLYSTTIMSESLMQLLGLACLYLGTRASGLLPGTLLGVVAVIRPLAAPIGVAYVVANRHRLRAVVVAVVAAVVVIAITMAGLHWWSGSPFAGIGGFATEQRGYADGSLFEWPFASLIRKSLDPATPLWKIAYIWTHVAFVLAGLALLLREKPRHPAWISWLGTNTLMAISIGGIWGFHEFHRFLIPGLPPLLFAWRRFLPRNALLWTLIALGSAGMAAVGLAHGY